jgi:hypothetical protein
LVFINRRALEKVEEITEWSLRAFFPIIDRSGRRKRNGD